MSALRLLLAGLWAAGLKQQASPAQVHLWQGCRAVQWWASPVVRSSQLLRLGGQLWQQLGQMLLPGQLALLAPQTLQGSLQQGGLPLQQPLLRPEQGQQRPCLLNPWVQSPCWRHHTAGRCPASDARILPALAAEPAGRPGPAGELHGPWQQAQCHCCLQ